MGGGASQKSGKTRAAAAASVRATVAPAVAASPAAKAAAAASPGAAALASPGAGAAAATTPSHTGPRRQASPGSAFARRERKGEVVASLRPEIELPSAGEAEKKTKLAPSSMEIDGDEEAEAAASAAAALEDLPRLAAVVELLTRAPPPDAKVLTDSLSDRAAFLEARVERFAAAFEKAAAAAASSSLPASTAMNDDDEEDQEAPLGSAPLAPVGVARQTARGVFVGRVVDSGSSDSSSSLAPSAPSDAADTAAPPPRLDLHSASLEGSASLSGGRRARLDVSALQHRWRLFPGQVVAVVGACPAGHTLVASALLPSAPPPKAPVKANEGGSLGLKVVAAAGPFTAPGDVAFEALDAVLALAAGNGGNGDGEGASSSSSSSSAADAVILVGPFVDERHPSVCSGSLDVSFDELFEREVISRIAEWSSNFGKSKKGNKNNNRPPPPVVLLPSPRDVAAGALTSAFPAKALALPRGTPSNIVALPNPATFRIGGLVFGATGHDVLRDLSASQAAGGLGNGSSNGGSNEGANANPSSSSSSSTLPGVAPKDRMAGLAGALLEQGCFYPLYPPARGSMLDSRLALGSGGGGGGNGGGNAPSTSSGAPSFSSAASRPSASPPYPGLAMPFSPDVLLLPSDLAPFARVATAEAPPALRVDESGELVVAATAAAGAGAPSSSSSPSASSAVPPPQPGVEAVAVNPGRAVTGGGGGGTAAVVILGARKQGAGKEDDDLASRCRVDIVRL